MEEDTMKRLLSSKRRIGMVLAAGLVVLVMIGSSNMLYSNGPKKQSQAPARQVFTYATADNLRQQVHLPDGTILSMTGGTNVAVHYYPESRVIKLSKGEIVVDAVDDKQRPLIVEGGTGKVIASGNRFNVRRDGHELDIAVAAGSVRVNAGSWWNPTTKFVNEGMRLQVSQASVMSDIQRIDRPVSEY
jgi:ferric-dicitrate binding protein FerR (iron transport regulator)